jgi:hypothetical protein
MLNKVLVLCQRKTGILYTSEGNKNVKEIIVPKITNIIQKILGTDDEYSIEYLSNDVNKEDVDILGELNLKNKFTQDFLTNNKNSYSLIILNTCPFILIDYEIIHKLLRDDGHMVFSIYPKNVNNRISNTQLIDDLKLFKKIDDYSSLGIQKNEIDLYKKIPLLKGGNRRTHKRYTKKYTKRYTKRYTKKYTKKIYKKIK